MARQYGEESGGFQKSGSKQGSGTGSAKKKGSGRRRDKWATKPAKDKWK
jgi:hypothetical protein